MSAPSQPAEPEAPVIGTDRLGRPFTNEERKHFAQLLRKHDFEGASLVALLFARKLTRSNEAARDVLGRANLRLVRWGWDPNEVSLKKRLCRLVWSEWTHEKEESARARRAEEVFLAEMNMSGQDTATSRSVEDHAERLQRERDEDARAQANIEKLRAVFAKKGDGVNLIWLDYTLRGETDLQTMARESGRDVKEFYRAADRRKRTVESLAAEANGVKGDEEKE